MENHVRNRLRNVLGASALVAGLVVPALPAAAVPGDTEPVFISEFHYDNDGTDQGEAFEVFAPACTDLTGWSVELYNGSNGLVYNTLALPSPVPALGGNAGVVTVDLPANGLQNGSPDGLALVDDSGTVRQFLSYEGTFFATNGPANGLESTDIGVVEGGGTPIGDSLQLSGTGSAPGDLTWTSGSNTFGELGLITPESVADICDGDPDPEPEVPEIRFNELHYDNGSTDVNEAIEVLAPAGTDLDGWSVVLYNGTNPANAFVYDTDSLSGVVADQGGGVGTAVVDYPTNGIQNGGNDGMALVAPDDTVVELLSWEGTMTAGDGPAAGITSTDLGVAEDGGTAADQSLQRTPDGSSWYGPACASFGELNDPSGPTDCPVPPQEVKIHEIQGTGGDSPLLGDRVIIEGVVVGDEEGPAPTFRGFFVQEEDADVDGDPLTSEGIFVFNFNNDDVELGDVVRVEGTVDENFGNTQLTDFVEVEVLDVEPRVATPATVEFPLDSVADLEAYEGMAATFPQELVISEYFNFDRFGETVVALPVDGEDRLFQPTALFDPEDPAAAERADRNDRSQITIDDGFTNQNPDDVVHPINREPVTLDNDFMGGETVTGLTGPIYYSFSLYRILPWATDDGYDTYGQLEPPPAPDPVGGDVRVATLNALNYFLTLDNGRDDVCGPNQDLECRGADSPEEFERQRVKLLNALEGMDADVVGLVEVENRPGVEPLADIVAGLNERLGDGTYDYVAAGDDAVVGTDAIKVGFIYRPATVELLGSAVLDTPEFLDPNDTGEDKNRAAVAATFKEVASGEVFSTTVNHLKSKGSGCGPGDDSVLAGSCNLTRTLAAGILADWIASDPTGIPDDDWMVMGDLNSYDKEDPIDVLRDAGFTDLVHEYEGEYGYSYLFSAELGYLDYAMSSSSLTSQVTGTTAWNINSDIPDLFDYDTSFKSPAQVELFDPTTPFRASDHDAVISGLDLDSGLTATADPLWPPNHKLVEIEFLTPEDVTATPLSATSSEADSGLSGGDRPGDIVLEDESLQLRAERFSLEGRTYMVDLLLAGDGQVRFVTVDVVVPHDQRDLRGNSGG